MKFSQDFFKQRSFEVVWAVFRVGEFISRQELRDLLEKRALGYLAGKNMDALAELEEMVKLAVQIGEIKDINGKVLLREIDNLREAIVERRQAEDIQRELAEGTVAEIFKEMPTAGQREPCKNEFRLPSASVESQKAFISEAHPRKIESGNQPVAALPDSEKESGKEIIDSAIDTQSMPESGKTLPDSNNSQSTRIIPQFGEVSSYERKRAILNLLQGRALCGMRDIVQVLPDVSERTLRYDIEILVKRKLVERVGNGGRQSFVRLRRQG